MRYSRRQHHVAGSKPRVSHLAVWGSYVGFFGEYLSRRLRTAAMSREEYMKLRPLRLMPIWSRHFAIMFTGFKSAPARSKSSWSFRQVKNKESGGNDNNQRDRLYSTNPSKVANVELYQVQSEGVLQSLSLVAITAADFEKSAWKKSRPLLHNFDSLFNKIMVLLLIIWYSEISTR